MFYMINPFLCGFTWSRAMVKTSPTFSLGRMARKKWSLLVRYCRGLNKAANSLSLSPSRRVVSFPSPCIWHECFTPRGQEVMPCQLWASASQTSSSFHFCPLESSTLLCKRQAALLERMCENDHMERLGDDGDRGRLCHHSMPREPSPSSCPRRDASHGRGPYWTQPAQWSPRVTMAPADVTWSKRNAHLIPANPQNHDRREHGCCFMDFRARGEWVGVMTKPQITKTASKNLQMWTSLRSIKTSSKN